MPRAVALLSALALFAAACGAEADQLAEPTEPPDTAPTDGADDEAVPTEAGAGVIAVSAAFPLAWLALEIAPEAVVTFLGAGGADPHDLELSPGDRALLETADVVLYMGALDFQPQLERAVEGAGGEVVNVRAIAGDEALIPLRHEDDHGHDDDDHSDGAYDPHLWFDATVMADVVLEIGAAFAEVDPEYAAAYHDNAESLRTELLVLDDELDALLSDCRFDTAIVSHEAYSYLLEPRGLRQEGISGAGGHGEASPQRIAELSARIREADIPAVLAEPLHGRDDAEALARESGAELLTIDPLEIATDEHFERGYPELLREQGEQFATALACEGGA